MPCAHHPTLNGAQGTAVRDDRALARRVVVGVRTSFAMRILWRAWAEGTRPVCAAAIAARVCSLCRRPLRYATNAARVEADRHPRRRIGCHNLPPSPLPRSATTQRARQPCKLPSAELGRYMCKWCRERPGKGGARAVEERVGATGATRRHWTTTSASRRSESVMWVRCMCTSGWRGVWVPQRRERRRHETHSHAHLPIVKRVFLLAAGRHRWVSAARRRRR